MRESFSNSPQVSNSFTLLEFADVFVDVTAGLNGANYLFWLHGLEPAIRETTQNRNNGPEDDHTLQMSNLNFSYPSRPDIPVLRGASLTVS